MTHDELLAKINKNALMTAKLFGWIVNRKESNALRAVVELHRPALDKEISGEDDSDTLGCAGCNFDFQYMTWSTKYPCRTIQAIEKELSGE